MNKAQEAAHAASREAETSSAQALDTVHEIFGGPDHTESVKDEPTLIRQWKNGGLSKLRERLQRADFSDLPDVEELVNG
tara:strand:+ start:834 stop:1070 length:237 start_codon:yes stop_codon:yes gene_type:complete